MFERLLDSVGKYLKKAYGVLSGQKSWEQMDAVKGNIDALADIREAYFIALEAAKESGKVENEGVPFSKKDAGGGKQYVEADRDVIKGDDPSKWGAQVTNFINREIRQGRDVTVYGIDGDALTITRDTAGKAQFRNKVKLPNGNYRLMTDSEYAVKLRAETHIDEVAEVSKRGAATVPDYSPIKGCKGKPI